MDNRQSLKAIYDNNASIITNPSEIANQLNVYFKSVFVEDNPHQTLPNFPMKTDNICEFNINETISNLSVSSKLKTLNCNKSMGPDRISNAV